MSKLRIRASWGVCTAAAQALFQEAVQRMQALGGEMVQVDFSAADKIAGMLYGDAFLAERYSALRSFLQKGGKVS